MKQDTNSLIYLGVYVLEIPDDLPDAPMAPGRSSVADVCFLVLGR